MDGKTELQMSSFQAPKIRLLRSMSIQNEVMQVFSLSKSLDCIWEKKKRLSSATISFDC